MSLDVNRSLRVVQKGRCIFLFGRCFESLTGRLAVHLFVRVTNIALVGRSLREPIHGGTTGRTQSFSGSLVELRIFVGDSYRPGPS